MGYMTGSDWRVYELLYEGANWDDLSDPNRYYEPGFIIYILIFKSLNFSFWHFLIINKIIFFLLYIKILDWYSQNFYWSLALFLSMFGLYIFIDNPLRNVISMSIFCFSIKYIIKRELFKYILSIFLAITFHYSAVILLPIYYLFNCRIKSTTWVTIYVIINIVFTIYRSSIENIMVSYSEIIPYIEQKVDYYIASGGEYSTGKILSIKQLLFIIFFVLLIIYRKKIEQYKGGKIIFNASMCYLIIFRVSLSFNILFRFNLYFQLLFIISLVLLLAVIKNKFKNIYILFLTILIYQSLHSTITSSVVYIPYTNYIQYIFQEKPSYQERDMHNYKFSPYK